MRRWLVGWRWLRRRCTRRFLGLGRRQRRRLHPGLVQLAITSGFTGLSGFQAELSVSLAEILAEEEHMAGTVTTFVVLHNHTEGKFIADNFMKINY